MILLRGNLLQSHKDRLSKDADYCYDATDIPLRVASDLIANKIDICDCYMGVQHRSGKLIADEVKVKSFVNDGVGSWAGNVDIKRFRAIHDLDYHYSKFNHSDCWHSQTDKDRSNIRIRNAKLELSGEGSQDKGKFISSETGVLNGVKMFEDGFIIDDKGRFKNKIPAVNLNNCRNSEFGSDLYPLDGKLLGHAAFRVMGRKRGSPRSINNIIHIYDDMKLEFDKSAKQSFIVRVYKRRWSVQDRLDNWDVAKKAIELGFAKGKGK